jgi:hypothetical protein
MKTQESTQQHGEAVLLAQIAELQKQLDDCLETADTVRIRVTHDSEFGVSTRVNYLINHIVAGALRPFHLRLGTEMESKLSIWSRLPYIFSHRYEFDGFWEKRPFRLAMSNLDSILHYMRQAEVNNYEKRDLECGAEDFCVGITREEHEGTILLRDAIELLYNIEEGKRSDLEAEEIDDLFFSIQIMIQCQRLSLAMEKPSA